MADVWDDARWKRSARRWRIAVLTVVVSGFALYWYERAQGVGPTVPAQVYGSVAGPYVTILHAASGQAGDQQPEYLVVEVGGVGDPVEVLSATLRDHGWRVLDAGGAVFGGSPSPGDGGYHLTWQPPSAAGAARRLLITIDNPPGWPV
ncbi:hypothetical protein [Catenulispora subtropica]|uniref:Uncharacterized protein n=1 Tax=Catenulispora subtropica TaxID=450798 RepID=A0ABP5BZB4_9ACTN